MMALIFLQVGPGDGYVLSVSGFNYGISTPGLSLPEILLLIVRVRIMIQHFILLMINMIFLPDMTHFKPVKKDSSQESQ